MTVSGSIGKGKTSWHYVIELGRDMNGKRKQKRKRGFKTKKEAQKALTEAIHAMNNGSYVEPTKMLMSEYLEDWLENKQIHVKKSTYQKYYWLVNSHIKPFIGYISLSKLTGLHIQQLYRSLATEKKLSNENIRNVHKVLNNALKQAVKLELIPKNVASVVEPPKATKNEIKVWDVHEVQQFLKVTQSNRYHIVYLIALTTGMRQGEILGLRWQDVDFDREVLHVRQTLSHDGIELNSHTKTAAGTRTIALPEQVLHALKTHKIIQAKEKLKTGELYENFDLIVSTSVGTPLHPRNLLRNFYSQIEKANLNKIRFHDLRHTHATLLLKKGVHPKIVSERLGHADTRITMDTYSHLLPNMQRDTAKEFGKMLFGT
ncbi:site-specific integrase [Cytobacillus firmus]|uniref:site-specific integrase n=1 Tax=Cytobacillus firmus TaxID=1399 RepID=UPI0018CCAEBD|nr:site-specific integrase [Cytobacillus firmus]MBG9589523.1 integrase [Cytobacillus firmus]